MRRCAKNIAFYRPDAVDEEVMRAVCDMDLESLVENLPEGLATRIGDGARGLSGGQAQRIALARACLDSGAMFCCSMSRLLILTLKRNTS